MENQLVDLLQKCTQRSKDIYSDHYNTTQLCTSVKFWFLRSFLFLTKSELKLILITP